MSALRSWEIAGLVLAAIAGAVTDASAANSYDNCVNYIDAVPLDISTPGTWCLRHDVITNAEVRGAVNIRSNNVTIDCNGFRLSNLPAGLGTHSVGVLAWGLSNLTVRNCTIQGFLTGVLIGGGPPGTSNPPPGTGHVIENNRLQQNRYSGIEVVGFGSIVQGNIVTHTGGGPGFGHAWGIRGLGGVDVIDNIVDGTVDDGVETDFWSTGIWTSDYAGQNPDIMPSGVRITGNRVRNLTRKGADSSIGISITGTGIEIRDNLLTQPNATYGAGVFCWSGDARVRDNVIKNYSTGINSSCTDDGGNVAY